MIYLDNAATTKAFDAALDAAFQYVKDNYFNPSATYEPALEVRRELLCARRNIAKRLNCKSEELYFTASATEANNWSICNGFKNKSGNIVISGGEHASVYETAMSLKNKGFDVRIAPLSSDGTVDFDSLMKTVDTKTSLVSLIHVSNETGALNDIKRIVNQLKSFKKDLIIHSDGVQAFCKTDNDVHALGVDLYSLSAHKIGGMKGIGALYIREGLNLSPFIYGGGQEKGMRSGTENVAAIIGFAEALCSFEKIDFDIIKKLRQTMIDELSQVNDVVINAKDINSNFILSVSVVGLRAEILQSVLSDKGVYVGIGSACSKKASDNRILSNMGLSQKSIEGSLRISFGPYNTLEEIKRAAKIIKDTIFELRGK